MAREPSIDDGLLLESIVENLPDMIFVKDAEELRFCRFNRAGEDLLGWDRDTLIGRNDHDFFPKAEADAFTAKDREVLARGELVEIAEEPIHTAAGERWLHTRKIPILGSDGRARYLLGISRDITELRRARRALDEHEARLGLILENFPGAVWYCDAGLRLVKAAGAHAVGLGLGDALGDPVVTRLPAPSTGEDLTALHEAARAGDDIYYEFAAGELTYEVRLQRLDEGVVGVALDVTARRRLDAARHEARMQQAQRMEALGVLAGGIAHDFNNMLVGMLGNASLALSRLPVGSAARADVERVVAAAERAADLTRQMLAYSGKGRFVVEPVDLSAIVREMADLLRVSISKGAVLAIDVDPDIPRVEADAAQIRQVLMNLLTNASDALVEGHGTIRVATAALEADEAYLRSYFPDTEAEPGRYVALEVSDSGRGMDEATRRRMFDPFFTTRPQGHGLGLAATLGIVRGHGGAIRVYSEVGRGTSVKVLLPALAEGAPSLVRAALPIPLGAVHGLVLVIDDEPAVRELARAVLEHAGLEVLTACDGEDGLRVFCANLERIGAVLLDMTMPRMNGEETFRALRRVRPDVRVVLSSGYNEQDATTAFAGKGLAGFLQKPYRAAELIAKIREQLAR